MKQDETVKVEMCNSYCQSNTQLLSSEEKNNITALKKTSIWQTLSQFSRTVRRKTLVITSLSVLLQHLIKLWRRLFWELLKNT